MRKLLLMLFLSALPALGRSDALPSNQLAMRMLFRD